MKQKAVKVHTKIIDMILVLPLIFVLGYLPLFLRVHFYESGISAYDWGPVDSPGEADLFLWIKMTAMIAAGAVMLILLAVLAFRKKLILDRFRKVLLAAVLVYGAMIFLSACVSNHRPQAFFGSFEMFESALYLLACLIAFIYAMLVVRREQFRLIAAGAAPGLIFLSLLCIFQAFGLNFLDASGIRMMITPADYWSDISELFFGSSLKGSYGTLYNPNYVLPLFGFVFFAAQMLFRYCKGKLPLTILLLILMGLSLLAILSSGSKTALFSLSITILIGLLITQKGRKRVLIFPAAAGLAALAFLLLSVYYGGAGRLFSVMSNSLFPGQKVWPVESMETTDSGVHLRYNGQDLFLSFEQTNEDDVSLKLFANNKLLPLYADENGIIYADDEDYEDIRILPHEEEGLTIITLAAGKKIFDFCNFKEPYGYLYRTPFGKFVKAEKVENAELFSDRLLSWRGGIWNRTLPLLKQHLILGSGSNTFLYEYPQNDYVYKINRGGIQKTTIEVKPHSFFLQQWVENGFPALIAVIVFYAVYLIWSVRLYARLSLRSFESGLGFGLFLGSLNYAVACLTTDSNVNTASFFWCCVGVGSAVNAFLNAKLPDRNDSFL